MNKYVWLGILLWMLSACSEAPDGTPPPTGDEVALFLAALFAVWFIGAMITVFVMTVVTGDTPDEMDYFMVVIWPLFLPVGALMGLFYLCADRIGKLAMWARRK